MSGVPKRSHEEGVTHPSSSSAKYPHEDSGSYPKSTHAPVTPPPAQIHQQHHHHQQPHQHLQSQSQSHLLTLPHSHSHPPLAAASASAYEVGSVKGPRSEPRDGERRSPLQLVYRSPSLPATVSSSDPHLAHTPVLLDQRDGTKDVRETRVENRENRSDGREIQGPKSDRDAKFERLGDDFSGKGNTGSYARNDGRETYGEGKREIQVPKSDRDAKPERLGDDFSGKSSTGSYTRDTKFDRESQIYNEKNAEIKMEKDGHAHSAWKDQKDYHRGKRAEGSSANVDPWVASRGNSQGSTEAGVKDFSTPVEGAHLDGRETVGENKVDPKSEDRFKDKDKKRKDLKHREWGDRDKDRNDRRGSLLVGSVVSEPKEIGREERETDRWERERMEQKDRERNKEKEKDHVKREPRTEKEVLQNEKELGEGPTKPAEQEYVAPEQKKLNEPEGWEKDERESKDKRRERDGDSETERAEKRSRISEKESEDGCLEGEGAAEREKDAFNYGVQQRKRMLRPRGSPQTTNRDRVRSRSQENEGVQGKSEVSIVVYKVGECMQELIKLWKEYEASQPDKSGDFASNGPTLEVRIPAEHVTATNRQVRGGQLWGTDIYTDDSDLVAVLMHTGYCRPTASPPPPTMQELRTTIRVLPSQDYYTSKLRNNVRSRAWGAGIGCSYRVERCYILKKGGGTIELEPSLTHSSTVEPTLAPMAVERSMTTRAAASNALRQQRFVREVTIQYNLCNEPWIKYSISIVADKGLKKPLFTSARLKKGEVLYLETHSCRYELCFAGEKTIKAIQASQQHSSQEAMEIDNNNKSQNHLPHLTNGDKTDSDNSLIDVFRWSRCKKPLPQKLMRSIGFPLPPDHIEVLAENLDWEDVQWSQTGVWIAGKEYTLARVHFLSPN
ncbi:hypothetical protein EUTSA_v10012626mg [Eutrema salsugineum]|uniref:Histone deacetylation protein Rxt3 n=1 Tax=Eutrema salsugineum TaxID=72664 RepID=V4LAU6_EUTSA|nr:zinc finger CCCH domain-containing protein 13 isoform X2 [Eutrema salsugineum]ESQ40794.1 hypothetical protein EUTSA_v10012626mg [Eutrema salsugineum]